MNFSSLHLKKKKTLRALFVLKHFNISHKFAFVFVIEVDNTRMEYIRFLGEIVQQEKNINPLLPGVQ